MTKAEQDILREALEALSENLPNSIVADLVAHFESSVVIELLTLYGGRQVKFPKVDTLWTSYRNQVIVQELVINNSKENRRQLAEYFGISTDIVSKAFSRYKERTVRVSWNAVENIIEVIYRKNSEIFHREMKQLFSDKYGVDYFSLHELKQNPEDLYLVREAMQMFTTRCVDDLNKHPVLVDRPVYLARAVDRIIKLIEERH